jgi:AcrR family transcriptional regulator
MPKVVDRRERRMLIVDALLRVAAKHGIEAVSLRHVAAEAGVTSGMVQHYFSTKDEMMAFAMVEVRKRHAARIAEAVGRLGPSPSPRDLVRTILAEVLPLDEPRRADGRVVLAFLAYAAVRPDAATLLRDDTQWILGFVADQIRAAQDAGAARIALDPAPAAASLVAMMEGLGMYLLAGQYSPQTALDTLDAQLALIFG